MKEDFAPLSVLLICNPDVKKRIGHGLDDDLFLRGKVPMTKSEVRSISLSKLRLHKDAVVWDVGAGTGSVSIEAASLAKDGVVYAIEKKDEAIDLLEQNKRKFGTDNLEIIKGLAPEALEGLPDTDTCFYRRFFRKFKRNPGSFAGTESKGACCHQCDCPGDGSRSDAVPEEHGVY